MNHSDPIDPAVVITALTGKASEAELRELALWRARSPAHEEEYRRLARVWLRAGEVRTEADDMTREPSAETVISLAERHGSSERRPYRTAFGAGTVWVSVAAAALVVLSIGLWPRHGVWTSFGPESLETGANEVATVTLQDRTVVRLAPESRLTFGGGAVRRVSLTGRAYFAVAKDPAHPFIVQLPSGEIEVKGTRFDVESRGADVRVAVVEGAVQVRAYGTRLELQANDVGTVGGPATPEVRRVDDPFQVIGWLQDFLAFESTPLERVVEEFRLRFGVRIEVLDDALWSRSLTGWFANQTPRQVIEAACTVLEAQCEIDTESVTMRVRH